MTDPNEPHDPVPQYPVPQYSQYQYQAPAPPAHQQPGAGLRINLGERGTRRPEARLGTALAGAGVALAIAGVLLWSITYLIQGVAAAFSSDNGTVGGADSRRLLGVLLSLAVVLIGYALAIRSKSGPLATAGVAASAIGMLVAMAFLSFSFDSSAPVSSDAVVLVSLAVWLVSYLFVPGARGHTFYLGLASVELWLYLLDKAEPSLLTGFATPTTLSGLPDLTGGVHSPDLATISALSFVFGLGYYALAALLDWRGRGGPATALVLSGFAATVTGIAAAANDFGQAGTGAILLVLGLLIASFAARAGRRFTTWVWSGAVALGIALLLAKVAGSDHLAVAGALFIAFGFLMVGGGYAATMLLDEPDEFTPIAEAASRAH